MAWSVDDRFLWVGLGVFFYVAARGISHCLRQTLDLSEIDEPTKDAHASYESRAEDSISIDSLQKLAASPNQEIANAAISLVVSHFALSDSACTHLTLSLFSSSAEVRTQTKQVLDLLDFYPLPSDFPKPDILRVDAVRNLQNRDGDRKTSLMCMAFFKAMNHMHHGLASHRDVADAVEAAMEASTAPPPAARRLDGVGGILLPGQGDDEGEGLDEGYTALSVESLDRLLSRAGSSSQPVRVPAAALSALLHEQTGRADGGPLARGSRHAEESPEEAEMRRRRNRAVTVVGSDEDGYLTI